MNKLEEYKNNESTEFGKTTFDSGSLPGTGSDFQYCFDRGFDAAIALDLPVKFHEWVRISVKKGDVKDNNNGSYLINNHYYISEELYQYWIDNIFEPE